MGDSDAADAAVLREQNIVRTAKRGQRISISKFSFGIRHRLNRHDFYFFRFSSKAHLHDQVLASA